MLSKDLGLSTGDLGACIAAILQDPRQIMASDLGRAQLTQLRLNRAKQSNQISSLADTENSVENSVRHNLENLDPMIGLRRPYGLLGPLLGMDSIMFDVSNKKVLIIGPRTEQEIFLYQAHGFNPSNVIGLDLISYSEYIVQGDMHNMPFQDQSFDVVVFSWVLGYSKNQKLAISEAHRVLKKPGIIAIGEQWDPTPVAQISQQMTDERGYHLNGTVTNSVLNLDDLLSQYSHEKLFSTEPALNDKNRVGWINAHYLIKNESTDA